MILLAKTFKGLEEVLADELRELGATDVKVQRRAVRFQGDQALLYRANLNLRTASRVLMPVLSFSLFSRFAIHFFSPEMDSLSLSSSLEKPGFMIPPSVIPTGGSSLMDFSIRLCSSSKESISSFRYLRSEAEQIKAEKLRLAARQSQKEKAADRLEKYLLDSMQRIGRTVIDRPQALIKIKQNPESTIIENELAFIDWAESTNHDSLLKYNQPSIKLNDVKALIRKEDKENVSSEQRVRFAHLERKTVLKIK